MWLEEPQGKNIEMVWAPRVPKLAPVLKLWTLFYRPKCYISRFHSFFCPKGNEFPANGLWSLEIFLYNLCLVMAPCYIIFIIIVVVIIIIVNTTPCSTKSGPLCFFVILNGRLWLFPGWLKCTACATICNCISTVLYKKYSAHKHIWIYDKIECFLTNHTI